MKTSGWHFKIFPRVPSAPSPETPAAPNKADATPFDAGHSWGPPPSPKRSYPDLTEEELAQIERPGSAGASGRGTLVGQLSVRQDGLLRRAVLTTEPHGLQFDLDAPPNEVEDRVGYRVAIAGNIDKVTDTVGRMSRPLRVMWGEEKLSDRVLQQIAGSNDVKAFGFGTLEGVLRARVHGHETILSLETQRYKSAKASEVVFKVRVANSRAFRHLDGIPVRVKGEIDKHAPEAGKINGAAIERVRPRVMQVGDFMDFPGFVTLGLGPHGGPRLTLDEPIEVEGQRIEHLHFQSDEYIRIGDTSVFGELGPTGPEGFAELRGVSQNSPLRFDENGFGLRTLIPLNGAAPQSAGRHLVLDRGRAREVRFGTRDGEPDEGPKFLGFTGRSFRLVKATGALSERIEPRVTDGVRTIDQVKLVTLHQQGEDGGMLWALHKELNVIYGLRTHKVADDLYATPHSVIFLKRATGIAPDETQ